MPTRAPRHCTASGCGARAGTTGRCEEHVIPRPKPKPRPRPSSSAQGYDYRWRVRSRRYLAANPVCATTACGAASEHTDHIDGDRTNWELWNLQALCRPCHSRKTARHDGGFGNRRTPRR